MAHNSVFALKLGDGTGWLITATPDTRRWVEKFGKIMKLKAGERGRRGKWARMFFIRGYSGKDRLPGATTLKGSKLGEDLPGSGWKAHDVRSLRLWTHQIVPDIICEIGDEDGHELDIIRMWLSLYIIYLRVQDLGGLPFHAALVERDGKGFLLAGPGDSGKSTLCRRIPPPWQALCDDETLIVRDDQKQYRVHPFPTWSDCLWRRSERSWNVQRHLPLSAIFFLEQAETDEAIPVGRGQTAIFINQSATNVWQRCWGNLDSEEERALKEKLFENACELARGVPAFKLRFSLKGRFWEEIERVLA